jgi:hypothetical protein
MKARRALVASALALFSSAVFAAGCSSASDASTAKVATQTSELQTLFSQETVVADFSPANVNNHGEGVVKVQTPHLNVWITFQNAQGIAWPTSPGSGFIFHPAADWSEYFGRDASGTLVDVPARDAARFVVHGESRRDICNGAALDVMNITVSDSTGHTYAGVTARLTVLARATGTASGSAASLHTENTSPGDEGTGDDMGGGTTTRAPGISRSSARIRAAAAEAAASRRSRCTCSA